MFYQTRLDLKLGNKKKDKLFSLLIVSKKCDTTPPITCIYLATCSVQLMAKIIKAFCQINNLFTCLVLAIKSITEELYQHFKLEIILSHSALSNSTKFNTFFYKTKFYHFHLFFSFTQIHGLPYMYNTSHVPHYQRLAQFQCTIH